MTTYLEAVKDHMANHPPKFGCSDAKSLLEMLYCCYCQSNNMETQQVREHFSELDGILSKLTWDENNQIFSIACQLCEECQQKAFLEGIWVGFRLYGELNTPSL